MNDRPFSYRALLAVVYTTSVSSVYFALGGLSNPEQYAEIATRLGTVFADFELEVFEARHHFDPPHRIEPGRTARALRAHWARADS